MPVRGARQRSRKRGLTHRVATSEAPRSAVRRALGRGGKGVQTEIMVVQSKRASLCPQIHLKACALCEVPHERRARVSDTTGGSTTGHGRHSARSRAAQRMHNRGETRDEQCCTALRKAHAIILHCLIDVGLLAAPNALAWSVGRCRDNNSPRARRDLDRKHFEQRSIL